MNAVQQLYTTRAEAYRSFTSLVRHGERLQRFLMNSGLLRPGLRVLDAGCGFGTATFALLATLERQQFPYQVIDAFDLTPAMLARFQGSLDTERVRGVRLREADVLRLDQQLPSSWRNYDLILSTSMLEYVSKPELPFALSALRKRLASEGVLLTVITRKNLLTRFLIDSWWRAPRYSQHDLREAFSKAGFEHIRFTCFPLSYFWLNITNHVVVAPDRTIKSR
jgi:SAM-dependent methyltransferase